MDRDLLILLASLHFKVIHIFHAGNMEATQIFFKVDDFNYPSASNPIDYIEVTGKDISNFFLKRDSINVNIGQVNVMIEKVDKIPVSVEKFSKDYSWRWVTSN